MRSRGEYIIWTGVKYLPRGTLEVCSSERSEILMDYGMIGPLGLPAEISKKIVFYGKTCFFFQFFIHFS